MTMIWIFNGAVIAFLLGFSFVQALVIAVFLHGVKVSMFSRDTVAVFLTLGLGTFATGTYTLSMMIENGTFKNLMISIAWCDFVIVLLTIPVFISLRIIEEGYRKKCSTFTDSQ
jgi:hypothetical protein